MGQKGAIARMPGGMAMPQIAARVQAGDPVQTFINNWGLNEDSVRVIESMPPEAVEVVVREFSPRGQDGDWNGKFIKFAANILKRVSGGWSHPAAGKRLKDPLEDFIIGWN